MTTNVTFRHTKSQHPGLQEAAIAAAENFRKYYDKIISTNVEFINDTGKVVQFTVHMNGSTLVAKETSDDFHKSLSEASDKIIRQIQKWKTKQFNKRTDNSTKRIDHFEEETDNIEIF